MIWHLYVDESGNFKDTNTPSLVGGFLLPESAFGYKFDQNSSISDGSFFKAWRTYLWDTMRKIPGNDLRNPWWQSFRNIHTLGHPLSIDAEEVYKREMSRYDVEHCCENSDRKDRWAYQEKGLNLICYLIRQNNGYIVIFDGGLSKPDVDSTTGYLSILAKGLVNLFGNWNKLGLPNEKNLKYPKLRVHIAERKNTTLANSSSEKDGKDSSSNKEDDKNSPTRNESKVIIDQQYKNQLFHTAYQVASSELFHSSNFTDMINSIEIMIDEQQESTSIDPGVFDPVWIGTVKRPNCRTVPCDYICNSYFSHKFGNSACWSKFVGTANSALTPHIILDLTQAGDISIDEMESMHFDRSYAQVFCRLLAADFPITATNEFKTRFIQADSLAERTFVEQIVSFFFEETRERLNIYDVIDRLNSTIQQTSAMFRNRALEAEFHANLHLFLYAMHTHLGDDMNVDIDADNVKLSISSFYKYETEKASQLYQKLAIREIVKYTDRFDYSSAQNMFINAKNSFDYHIEYVNDLSQIFDNVTSSEERGVPIEYAKMVSSYLQLIRHIIHEDPSKKAEYRSQTDSLYHECLKGYREARDLCWLHQTMADLASEYGEYQKAFEHLLLSAVYEFMDKPNIPLSNSQKSLICKLTAHSASDTDSLDCTDALCMFILQAAEEYEKKNHYILHHYLRLASSDNRIGSEMYRGLLSFYANSLPSPDELSAMIPDIHCRTQVLWRLAKLLHSQGKSKEAKQYYNKALLYLTGNGNGTSITIQPNAQTIFLAIAIGVAAEETDIGIVDRSALIDKLYTEFVSRIENSGRLHNPFEGILPSGQLSHEKLVLLSRKIGY